MFPSQFKKYKVILEGSIKYQIQIYAWLEAEENEAKEMNYCHVTSIVSRGPKNLLYNHII